MIAVGDAIQLRGNTQPVTRLADTAFEYGADIELPADLADIFVFSLEGESGSPRHHSHVGNPAERVDDLFSQTVAEVFLVLLRAQIEERKNHHRRRGYAGRLWRPRFPHEEPREDQGCGASANK